MQKYNKLKNRHFFNFKTGDEDDPQEFRLAAKCKPAKKKVELMLSAAHVRKSIAAQGQGNTQKCAVAQCVKSQADRFPHPIVGMVDWTYNRAYVTSKASKKDGLAECTVYAHHNQFARKFDLSSDKPSVLQELLTELEEKGDQVITLYPPPMRKNYGPQPTGKRTGKRRKFQPRGANLRYAIVKGGLI